MKMFNKVSLLLFCAMTLGVVQFAATPVHAQSSFFTSLGCVDCHSAPTVATCAGCHHHSGTLTATKNKTTAYAPGETVSITLASSGGRSGWIGARLYNQSGVEIARSTGSQSGMGGSTLLPAVLSAPAPAAAGNYTWRIAYLGNEDGNGGGDVHSEKSVNVAISVAAPADTTAPIVSAFTLPATSTSLTVPVSSFTATDNVAVSGYLINTSASAPSAAAAGWNAVKPVSVIAAAPGSVTFYAWAKDAANNVSLSKSATVVITLPDTTAPVVSAFTLPATNASLKIPVSSFVASDNVGVAGYRISRSAVAPTTGWNATPAVELIVPYAGTYTFYAWAKDAANNVSLAKSATVVVTIADKVLPVVSSFTLPETSASLTVPVSSFVASDNRKVVGYRITRTNVAPEGGWSVAPPTEVTVPDFGLYTFYAWAKDVAGNVSLSKSAKVAVSLTDIIKPTLVLSTLTNGAATNNPTLNVSGTASDSGGLASVTVNANPVVIAADGSFSVAVPLTLGSNLIEVVAIDQAGNQIVRQRTITYDPSAPLLTVNTPTDNTMTGKRLVDVSGSISEAATVSVANNGETPQIATVVGNAFTAAIYLVPGLNTIDIDAVDAAGNHSSAKRTITFDNNIPTLAVTSPAQDITTSSANLLLAGTVADSLSNVSIRVTVDGKVYAPAVVDGAFQKALTLVEAKQYAITITAIDEVGHRVSVVRNVIYQP